MMIYDRGMARKLRKASSFRNMHVRVIEFLDHVMSIQTSPFELCTDFQDIHVMIFIGFAFLMTFLKRFGYSATGLNLFVAALCIQWAILMRGFFEMEHGTIK